MASKKLDQYRGKLSPIQLAEGINAAQSNAKRLAEDAALLLEAKRYPSAASLAVLSIEESGKVPILRALALARDNEAVNGSWRDYRSHTKKNVVWLLPQLFANGARRLDEFSSLFDESSDHPVILDQVKQLGFYTDCLGNAHWSLPEYVVDESLATTLVQIARIYSKDHLVTTQEVELWIKHMGPVWRGDPVQAKQALINWYAEMQQNGLAPEGMNAMEEFIMRGVSSEDG